MTPGWYLGGGGVWRSEGAEGRPVEHGGVEGRYPQSQVPGGDADGRAHELDLLNQLIHRLQSPEGGREKETKTERLNQQMCVLNYLREEKSITSKDVNTCFGKLGKGLNNFLYMVKCRREEQRTAENRTSYGKVEIQ